MRIGIDCRLWSETGIGRYTRNLVVNLLQIDKSNEYFLFILPKNVEEIQRITLDSKNVELIEVNIPWHSIKEQLIFPRIISRQKLELMHFTYFSLPIIYRGSYLLTIHDLILHHFSTGRASTKPFPIYYIKHLFYKNIIKFSAKNARKIIAVSNATKNEILDHFNVSASKVEVVYEGVEILSSSKIKMNFPFILYVGNLYPHKNIEKTLEAFKLAKKPKDSKLVVIGKEDYFRRRTEQDVKNLNLEDRVLFTGKISDKHLAAYYRNAKATIIPSLMEGFGLPALEAMANGSLVICSKIPSLIEVCADAAIYFDPQNTSSIKKSIEDAFIIDSSEYIKKGKARSSLFSWKKMAKETLSIYESI